MKCPFCAHPDTRVADSRLMEERNAVRRRRHCPNCGKRFGTLETAELKMPAVIGPDKKRSPFNAQRLRNDLTAAVRKSALTPEQIDETVRLTEHRLYTSGQRDIPSAALADMVLKELLEHNTEAAVRFAALHKRFDNPADFASWLAQAVKTGGKA
ncbi:transcriptional repressor NrdR [Neisseria meningitidis]|uniref:transcriptional regulator NrdR n=1 Tax=Neisseria meningitidis TaxID=487 RepID=UPI001C5597B4|nr:transcriptional regulator NrdR [Neisseria meningitidis]MBW3877493.1 transcriptional repressor NrdR [Neisseria meningitidis]MBW3917799.1 transcriptional repressor NrdR [Neisseria meningitidis]